MLTRSSLTIRLHPADDVVIARQQLVGGTKLLDENVAVLGLDDFEFHALQNPAGHFPDDAGVIHHQTTFHNALLL